MDKSLTKPKILIEGWWTSLDESPDLIIKRYQWRNQDAKKEWMKSVRVLEALSSGSMNAFKALLHISMFTNNCLGLIAKSGQIGELIYIKNTPFDLDAQRELKENGVVILPDVLSNAEADELRHLVMKLSDWERKQKNAYLYVTIKDSE